VRSSGILVPFAGMLVMLLGSCGAGPNYRLPEKAPPAEPPPTAQQSGAVTITPSYVAIAPGQSTQFVAESSLGGTLQWMVNNIAGGNSSVGLIDAKGNYTAPLSSSTANVVISAALISSPASNFATAVVAVIQTGQLTPTPNPQVVVYSIYLPAPGNVSVQFGTQNLMTSPQDTPSPNGGMVHVYVAGMIQHASYHMRAMVNLDNGASFIDADHTFNTGSAPETSPLQITIPSGASPQSGVEIFDTVIPHTEAQLFATDLQGNVLWTYRYEGSAVDAIQAAKFLPNGHFLLLISFASSLPTAQLSNLPGGTVDAIREIDLAGNTIREVSLAQLEQSLTAQGYSFTLQGFHHDVLPLPNGHIVIIADLRVPYTNLIGSPGTTSVLGDLLIDVDENVKPTWVWSTFDHLDVNRHPMNFPDWTHGNAILYSADDHDLLFSMRHQNWIVKIDYQDGNGSGNVMWRLGPGGDFKLLGGTDPTDWFYAQHGPSFFSKNTIGVFELGLMDNGDDRQFPPGVQCDQPGQPPCHYSRVPVLQVDENAMTATLLSSYRPNPDLYSYFGGNVDQLANGDIEADFCAVKSGATIQELSESTGTTQIVWQAITPKAAQFRVQRLSSLYPGVQW
jgi:arylsulfate sulfotransferase